MCFDYDEDSTILTSPATRKARKAHKCDDCGGTIPVGATYWYGSWLNDGSVWSFYGCEACRAIRLEIKRRELASGCAEHGSMVPYGEGILAEYLSEVGPDEAASIRQLATKGHV